MVNFQPRWWNGLHEGLKNLWTQVHVGSNPTLGTKVKQKLSPIANKALLAYVIGLALGDGNLSNPNGRATRLRITCDLKYPNLIKTIQTSIQKLFPQNKVSLVKRNNNENCVDISCYSNRWEKILGWQAKKGSKLIQKVSIPSWIRTKDDFKINCLKGLIETDGSIYLDRGYKTIMFTTAIYPLAQDVFEMISSLGFAPKLYKAKNSNNNLIYRIRIAKSVQKFLDLVKPDKS